MKAYPVAKIIPLLLLAAVWQAASISGWLPASVLPPLTDVAVALAAMLRSGELMTNTLASFARAAVPVGRNGSSNRFFHLDFRCRRSR